MEGTGRAWWLFSRICDADHAAGDAASRVTDRLAAIIGLGMDNYAPPDDRVLGPRHADIAGGDFIMGFALAVRLDIAQVAGMTLSAAIGEPVGMTFRVVMAAGAHAVLGRAVAELVDVKRVFLAGSQTFEMGHDFHAVRHLSEGHFPAALVARGGMEHGDDLLHGAPVIDMSFVMLGVLRRSRLKSWRKGKRGNGGNDYQADCGSLFHSVIISVLEWLFVLHMSLVPEPGSRQSANG